MNATQFWQFGDSKYPYYFYLKIDVSLTNTPNAEVRGTKGTFFAPPAGFLYYSFHRIIKKISKNFFLMSIDNNTWANMSYKDFYDKYKTNRLNLQLLFDDNNPISTTYRQYANIYLDDELLKQRAIALNSSDGFSIAQSQDRFRQLSFYDIKDKTIKIVIENT